jgi:nicotinamide-nucleotide amidase
MYGEIITIGDELISGRTLDLNAMYAAGRLTASGLRVSRITSVGDDRIMVSKTLSKALKSSRFVIITGGLGPTDDDMTNEIVAAALNRSLCLDQQMLEKIKRHIEAKGVELTPSIEKMAWLPEGSRIINPDGAMCGCCIIEQDVRLYFLPGIPEQMRLLLDNFVLPEILSLYEAVPSVGQNILKLYGVKEHQIAETIKSIHGKIGDVVLGFYPRFPENHITLSLSGNDESVVVSEVQRVENLIRRLLGPFIFATGNQDMEEAIGRKLMDTSLTISVAESCTGGLIGHRLTNVPGSSVYFMGGVVAYSNQSKMDILGVNQKTLETHGAVSDQTVREMVKGLRKCFNTELSLAVTGIAGPDGGGADKPVGTVYIGLAAGDDMFSGKYLFWGDRGQIKLETSTMALDWVRRYINGNPFIPGV